MMPKIVILPTDIVIALLIAAIIGYGFAVSRSEELQERWRYVFSQAGALISMTVLTVFLTVAAVDSVHYRSVIDSNGAEAVYDVTARSLLDDLLPERAMQQEKSYSSPLAVMSFEKHSGIKDGVPVRDFEPLDAGSHLKDRRDHLSDVFGRAGFGILIGAVLSVLTAAGFVAFSLIRRKRPVSVFFTSEDFRSQRTVWMTISALLLIAGPVFSLWPYYHVLGTDQTGNDILYQALKSIRTALVIGTLATASMLPFAVVLGISSGFFKGRVDDVIQYIYTTLSSIPSVLLIAASVLMIQVFIDAHPGLYETGLERSDMRLMMLSLIIGMTGWATLARLLRAETLKISQMDYVQAARAFGAGSFTIMRRHIFPNVIHIVLIVAVLDFSSMVLYEAVLSYVGVGVDPTTYSFGSMINAGRLELSRTPVIWWNLASAFAVMLSLVLSANVFAGVVRDAFDPRRSLAKPGRKIVNNSVNKSEDRREKEGAHA